MTRYLLDTGIIIRHLPGLSPTYPPNPYHPTPISQ
jgi:hypothetical protein